MLNSILMVALEGTSLLYKTQSKVVFRRARAILRDDDAAKDVTQEVFLRAHRAIGRLREGVSPSTWLYRVTTNYCLNWKRNQTRRDRLLALRAHAMETVSKSTAEDRVAASELLALVPKELAEIAAAYYIDELKQDEIAQLLGSSRRTIGHRLEAFRAAAARSTL